MTGTVTVRNRQRVRPVNAALFRQIARRLLCEHLRVAEFDLAIHLVSAPFMARINQEFLGHDGSTDVITFDYRVRPNASTPWQAELLICVEEAVVQARRFATHWTQELVRYLAHGLLHLQGHSDLRPASRRQMKREEDRLLRQLSQEFTLSRLARARVRRSPGSGKRRRPSFPA